MAINQFSLLKVKRFLPLFLTQFLGGLNDNLYKSALGILLSYTLAENLQLSSEALLMIATGIFMLPFILFSATAGQLADKYDKSRMIQYTKLAEIAIALLAALACIWHSPMLVMAGLFLLGTQAAFFGPLKYSILPDHLHKDELIAGNGLMEMATYVAILLGTMIGSALAALHVGPQLVVITVMVMAFAGYFASRKIPRTGAAAPLLKLNPNILQESISIVRHTLHKKELFPAILGISWFWLIGVTYVSQFPAYAKNILGAELSVVALFMSFFTVGIAIGSLLCNRLLKGKLHATFVPLAALGMTVFSIDLVLSSQHIITKSGKLVTMAGFLSFLPDWHILIDLLLISLCGGIYIVPLYAILQYESEPEYRSRAIACNNIINALFIVAGAIVISLMLLMHFSVTSVYMVAAVANLIVAVYICRLLPEEFIRSFLIWIFKLMYRVEVRGMENYNKAGGRVLVVANHMSSIDAALLAAFFPDRLSFAINTQEPQKGWIKWIFKLISTYPLDPTNPLATKSLIEYLRKDHRVVIFPEGRISVTGGLMKIYEAPGLIADKAGAKLLPIRIQGAQYTPFSHLEGKLKIRWFPKITLTVLEPRTFDLPASISGRERRRQISMQLYDVMADSMFLSSPVDQTLFESFLEARRLHGVNQIILEDIDRNPMSYQRLLLGSLILGGRIAKNTKQGEYVGVLLPNTIANVVTFLGMQAYHRVPAMLNYTAGVQNIISASRLAQITTVYSSRRFVERASLQDVIDGLIANNVRVIYLEDVRAEINIMHKLLGKLYSYFPKVYYHWINGIKKDNHRAFINMPCVVLFTSGSEGTPKGVVLSHFNVQSNRYQMVARVDFTPSDRVFNALPMFHAFGLTTATLLPIMSGMRTFLYPSPLHYKIVPEMCYDTNSTILFGTDTFLSNYAKCAHPYDFYSIRYIFAGAEKLRQETHNTWMQKFGIRLFEGYGATEASPVLAMNTPLQYRFGTVGRLVPGMHYKLRPVDGITDGFRLLVTGPNVMLGYILADAPGKIQPPEGYYDTGDIVSVDEAGFISIKGRAKRFAKVAGEMVSLTAVEQAINSLWSEKQNAVTSRPDPRKGEQIVLITNNKHAEQSAVVAYFKQHGLAEIGIPKKIIIMEQVPLLGSGKIDYQAVKAIAEQQAVDTDVAEDSEEI